MSLLRRQLRRAALRVSDQLAGPATVACIGRAMQLARKRPGRAERILVVRLDEIGDLVLTLPLLSALRTARPTSHITLMVRPPLERFASRIAPEVDDVVSFAVSPRPRWSVGVRMVRSAARSAASLARQGGVDLVLSPRPAADTSGAGLVALATGAPLRVGIREATPSYSSDVGAYFTELVSAPATRHDSERAFSVLQAIGVSAVWSPPRILAKQRAQAIRAAAPLRIALAPGAGSPRREWPADRFATVLTALARSRPLVVLLFGLPGQGEVAQWLMEAPGIALEDYVGRVSLEDVPDLLAGAAVFLGADSGLAHVAAALGIPTVVVSCHPLGGDPTHNNSPERFRPLVHQAMVVRPAQPASPSCSAGCESDMSHCIREVTTDEVVAALQRLLVTIEGPCT